MPKRPPAEAKKVAAKKKRTKKQPEKLQRTGTISGTGAMRAKAETRPAKVSGSPTASATAPQFCYPLQFPERYTSQSLAVELRIRLAGTRTDGAEIDSRKPQDRVVWVDAGDELLVHLDSIQIRILDRLIGISIDVECDQTGRQPMVCLFATGAAGDEAGLVFTTDEYPRGNDLLVSRWGKILQSALWGVLLQLIRDHAAERRVAPAGLAASPEVLQLFVEQPVSSLVKGVQS